MNNFFTTNKVQFIAPDSGSASAFTLAAGATTVNSSAIDVQALNCAADLAIIVGLGVVANTATGTIKVQGSEDASTWVDIAGTSQAWADTDDYKKLGVEIIRPTYRYYRVVTARATANTEVQFIQAIGDALRLDSNAQLTSAGQFVRAPEIFSNSVAGTA